MKSLEHPIADDIALSPSRECPEPQLLADLRQAEDAPVMPIPRGIGISYGVDRLQLFDVAVGQSMLLGAPHNELLVPGVWPERVAHAVRPCDVRDD